MNCCLEAELVQPTLVAELNAGIPAASVESVLDGYPDYPNDAAAAADGYEGRYYFYSSDTDEGIIGTFKRRQDI